MTNEFFSGPRDQPTRFWDEGSLTSSYVLSANGFVPSSAFCVSSRRSSACDLIDGIAIPSSEEANAGAPDKLDSDEAPGTPAAPVFFAVDDDDDGVVVDPEEDGDDVECAWLARFCEAAASDALRLEEEEEEAEEEAEGIDGVGVDADVIGIEEDGRNTLGEDVIMKRGLGRADSCIWVACRWWWWWFAGSMACWGGRLMNCLVILLALIDSGGNGTKLKSMFSMSTDDAERFRGGGEVPCSGA